MKINIEFRKTICDNLNDKARESDGRAERQWERDGERLPVQTMAQEENAKDLLRAN